MEHAQMIFLCLITETKHTSQLPQNLHTDCLLFVYYLTSMET